MERYQKVVETWQAWHISTVPELEQHMDNFRVLFAYHSGKIENDNVTYADTREIFENGRVCGFTGAPRTLFELQNQKLCYDFLKEKIIAKQPITTSLLLDVHRTLTGGTFDERRYVANGERPGEFKRHDYVTGIYEVGALPEDVPQEIESLLRELQESGAKNLLLAAAYFHAALENIHPFADGNGRVGRTMMNYWLMINDHPPIVIHEENRRTYYGALQIYDESEDLTALVDFLKQETTQTWQRQMPELQAAVPHRTHRSLNDLCADAKAKAAEANNRQTAAHDAPAPERD